MIDRCALGVATTLSLRLGPCARALERPLPVAQQRLALVRAHRRLVAALSRASCARTWSSVHSPTPTPARYAAPSAVVSAISGTTTGTPSTSAWNCISQSLPVAPPSARSSVSSTAARPLHRADGVDGLVGDRLERGAREVRASRAAGQADDRPARVRVPVRRSEPGQRRARSRRRRCPRATPASCSVSRGRRR